MSISIVHDKSSAVNVASLANPLEAPDGYTIEEAVDPIAAIADELSEAIRDRFYSMLDGHLIIPTNLYLDKKGSGNCLEGICSLDCEGPSRVARDTYILLTALTRTKEARAGVERTYLASDLGKLQSIRRQAIMEHLEQLDRHMWIELEATGRGYRIRLMKVQPTWKQW